MKDSLSPDESMAVIEHLQAEIAELKGFTLRLSAYLMVRGTMRVVNGSRV